LFHGVLDALDELCQSDDSEADVRGVLRYLRTE
jgi:hypothetical protein